jgi:excisionase family DNA binding protein
MIRHYTRKLRTMDETTPVKLADRRAMFPDRPWKLDEAADYLSVSVETMPKLIAVYGLPAHKMGTARNSPWRFYRDELDTWLRNRCAVNRPDQEQTG